MTRLLGPAKSDLMVPETLMASLQPSVPTSLRRRLLPDVWLCLATLAQAEGGNKTETETASPMHMARFPVWSGKSIRLALICPLNGAYEDARGS